MITILFLLCSMSVALSLESLGTDALSRARAPNTTVTLRGEGNERPITLRGDGSERPITLMLWCTTRCPLDAGTMLSIVGATGSTMVSYILPGGIYYVVFPNGGIKRYLALFQVKSRTHSEESVASLFVTERLGGALTLLVHRRESVRWKSVSRRSGWLPMMVRDDAARICLASSLLDESPGTPLSRTAARLATSHSASSAVEGLGA